MEREKAVLQKGILEGKQFVLTGHLEELTRDQAKKLIESKGGRVASVVSDKIGYVVVGSSPGSKLDKAKKLGIRIMDEVEFKMLISQ